MSTPARWGLRAVPVLQGVLGVGLLVRPDRSAQLLLGRDTPVPASWLIRGLGGRLLAQSVVEVAAASPGVVRAGAGIDALHAASMIPFSLHGRYRRAAATSAAVATASAVLSAWVGRPRPPARAAS